MGKYQLVNPVTGEEAEASSEEGLSKAFSAGFKVQLKNEKGEEAEASSFDGLKRASSAGFAPLLGETPSAATSAALGAVQSVAFDFADELEGLVRSGQVSGKSYEEARDKARARYKEAQEAHPWAYGGGALVGGLAIPGAAGVKLGRAVLAKGAANLAAEAAGGALLGAVSGAGSAEKTSDIPASALTSAAFGGILSAGLGALGGRKAAKEAAKELSPEEGKLVAQAVRAAEAKPALTLEGLAELKAQAAAKDGPQDAKRFFGLVEKMTKTEGQGLSDQALVDLYNNQHRLNESLRDVLDAQVKALDPGLEQAERLASNRILASGDVHRLATRLDELTKTTDIAAAVEGIHVGSNKTQAQLAEILAKPETVRAIEAVPRLEGIAQKVDFMRKAELGEVPEFTNFFKDLRENLNKNHGYNIPEVRKTDAVKVYVPQKLTSKGEIYAQITDAIKANMKSEVTGALNHLVPENLRFSEANPYTPEKAKAMLKRWFATDVEFDKRLVQTNNALRERNEFVPRLLRDLNHQSLVTRYTNEAFKTANVRPYVFNLLAQAQALEDQGLSAASNALKDYAAGVAGELGFVPRVTQRLSDSWQKLVADKGLPAPLAKVPEFLNFLSSQVYTSTMGVPNISTPLRNMSQTFTMAAPEVGGAYGYGLLSRAWLAKGNVLANLAEEQAALKARGLLPEHHLLENIGEHGTGLAGEKGFQWTGKVEQLNQKLMALNSLTETLNRSIAAKMGDKWAEDLLGKASKGALNALSKAPSAVQGKARVLLENGDKKGLQDLLARHLVTRTQFIYGKAGASPLSRTLGPMLSMFSKYPVNVGTDIAYALTNGKDAKRLFERYGAALALAVGMNQVAEDAGLFETKAGRVLFGRSLLGYTPFLSPPSLPPAVKLGQALYEAVVPKPGRLPREDKSLEKLKNKVAPFVPVLGNVNQGFNTLVKEPRK